MNLKPLIAAIDEQMDLPFVATAFGLAQRYYESPTSFYAGVIDEKGEVTNCFLQDKTPLSYYHRTSRSTFDTIEREGYGDKDDRVRETTEVDLVVYGVDLKITSYKLADIFVAAIPSYLDTQTCESLNVSDCRIDILNYEIDPSVVWREETTEPSVRAGLNKALIKVRYRIQCTYRRGCVPICDEC